MTKVGTATAERSFSDRGVVARQYKRYLATASITLVAFTLVSVFLLPLLYMVSVSFQQPSQITTPGAPPYPAAPLTGTYQGQEYPIYEVPIDGTTRNLML